MGYVEEEIKRRQKMDWEEPSLNYVKEAIRTESKDFDAIRERLTNRNIRLLHATMGLCTEAGEALDALKKHLFYGKELDVVNLLEELGDLFWYAAIMADETERSFDFIKTINIEKLRERYPERFKEFDAISRNLEQERNVLNKLKETGTK